jgi:hypothetical protein
LFRIPSSADTAQLRKCMLLPLLISEYCFCCTLQ